MTKGLIVALVLTGVCMVGGVVLLGLPGAILFELSAPLLQLLFGRDALKALPPDSLWPIAIIITVFWPLSIIGGYVVAFRLLHATGRGWQILSFAAILVLWDAVLSSVC